MDEKFNKKYSKQIRNLDQILKASHKAVLRYAVKTLIEIEKKRRRGEQLTAEEVAFKWL